jgi:hypothetical protein
MKDRTATVLKAFLAVMLAISAILFVIFYTQGADYSSVVLSWAYILLVITAAITILFPIAFFVMNPKKGLTALIGILGFVVLYLIAYFGFASTGNVSEEIAVNFDISESVSKMIGGILYMTYILGGLAILSIVYASISSLFK